MCVLSVAIQSHYTHRRRKPAVSLLRGRKAKSRPISF